MKMVSESVPVTYDDVTAATDVTTFTNDDITLNVSLNGSFYNVTDVDNEAEASDAIWILTSTFIIFTMQSGFGLLESGSVSPKNEVNIMVKNAVDVIVGGVAFWMFGYAFSFGADEEVSNSFCGWGYFFVTTSSEEMGHIYSKFFFQASFATTATTIVSGAMAERTKLEAYIIFSFCNTLIFCFPAHWIWAENGWLAHIGFVDIAGSGPVHLVGGTTGLIATLVLKPRLGRFESKYPPPMGSPTNALLGMFMLWWGWLGFNCGSTFGISGFKWKLAARSALATLNSSIGGGCMGLGLRSAISTFTASVAGGIVALVSSFIFEKRKFDVSYLINGILGSLVSITALCALAEPWEGLIIGAVGASLALAFCKLEEKLKIDDPVGCVGVHAIAGSWGLISVGLFAKKDQLKSALSVHPSKDIPGLFYGGGPYLLGVQVAGLVTLVTWTVIWSFIILSLINVTIGLRISEEHEILGADLVEHGVGDLDYDKRTDTIIGMKFNNLAADAQLNIKYSNTANVQDCEHYIKDFRRISRRSSTKHEHVQDLVGTPADDNSVTVRNRGDKPKKSKVHRRKFFGKKSKKYNITRNTPAKQHGGSNGHSNHGSNQHFDNAAFVEDNGHTLAAIVEDNGHTLAAFVEDNGYTLANGNACNHATSTVDCGSEAQNTDLSSLNGWITDEVVDGNTIYV